MSCRRATVVAILGVVLAACSAGVPPGPSATAAPAPSATVAVHPTADPTVVGEPTIDPATPSPSPLATRSPRPTPTPTHAPLPPKPTGIDLETPCALDCRPSDFTGYRVTWKAPRTKGVEIRAYGVTTCFRTDAPEGKCLRRGTRLPNDTRVLLAKGPAAKGRLLLPLIGYGGTIQFDGWCAAAHWAADDGPGIFSIVLAAYDQNGHSIFTIVSTGHYERGECWIDVY